MGVDMCRRHTQLPLRCPIMLSAACLALPALLPRNPQEIGFTIVGLLTFVPGGKDRGVRGQP